MGFEESQWGPKERHTHHCRLPVPSDAPFCRAILTTLSELCLEAAEVEEAVPPAPVESDSPRTVCTVSKQLLLDSEKLRTTIDNSPLPLAYVPVLRPLPRPQPSGPCAAFLCSTSPDAVERFVARVSCSLIREEVNFNNERFLDSGRCPSASQRSGNSSPDSLQVQR